MHRIDTTFVEADKFGTGKDGFTEGSPGVTPATEVSDDWLDGVQEELCNTIEDAGITLVKGTRNQLSTALKRALATLVINNQTTETNPKAFSLSGIIWSSDLEIFVAVGQADGADSYILTSPDGTTWTERAPTVAKNITLNSVVWSSDLTLFVAVGNADGTDAYIVTSPDGTTWTERSNPKNFALYGLEWCADLGVFVAVGQDDGPDAYFLKSFDGTNWIEVVNPADDVLYEITWSADLGVFIAVGDDDGVDAYITRSLRFPFYGI